MTSRPIFPLSSLPDLAERQRRLNETHDRAAYKEAVRGTMTGRQAHKIPDTRSLEFSEQVYAWHALFQEIERAERRLRIGIAAVIFLLLAIALLALADLVHALP